MTTAAITWSEIIVTIHVLAVVVAFGGALAYPLWFQLIRRGTPEQRAFFHQAQARLGKFLITPAIIVIFATGAYLASDQDVWDTGWVLIPTAMLAIILVLGVGVLGPSEERLIRHAEAGDQRNYDIVLRRVKIGTWFAAVLVVAATLLMVARVPDSAGPEHGAASAGAAIFVDTGCGSCHTLEAAHTSGTVGPNLDEAAADLNAGDIRAAIEGHPQNFAERLSGKELDTLVHFIAKKAGSSN